MPRLRSLVRLSSLLPLAILVVLSMLWGATFSISKVAIEAGVAPLGYALWQVIGAAVVLLLAHFLKRERLHIRPQHLFFWGVTGLLGVAAPISSMYIAIGHIPAGMMAIVAASVPLFTYALTGALRLERFSWYRIIGLSLGFAGAALLLAARAGLPGGGITLWIGVAFLMPFFYAVGTTYTARSRPAGSPTLPLTVGMLVFAAAGLLPIVIVTGNFYVPTYQVGPAELAIAGQIVVASLGYILFFKLIQIAGPTYFSQVGYLVTVSGLLYAMLLLGERYSLWVWAGAAVLMTGVALVNKAPGRGQPASSATRRAAA